jgi:hypothetical protein
VRDAVVDTELQHLRVDHDHPALVRRQAVEDRQDHGVDAHRLARTGGARDQQVGHAGEVGDVGLAADGLAQRHGQGLAATLVFGRGKEVTQIDGLAVLVGQLDADGVPARHHRDPAGGHAHRAGDVVGERHHAGRLHAGGGNKLIEGDHRAGADLVHLAADPELGQDALEQLGVLAQRALVELRRAGLGLGQHRELGQRETARLDEFEGRLRLALLTRALLGRKLRRLDLGRLARDGHGDRFERRVGDGGLAVALGDLGGALGLLGELELRLRGQRRGQPVAQQAEFRLAQADGVAQPAQGQGGEDGGRDRPGQRQVGPAQGSCKSGERRLAPEPTKAAGERPGGGWCRPGERRGQRQRAGCSRQGAQAKLATGGVGMRRRRAAQTQDDDGQRQQRAGQAQGLDADVGERRPQQPQRIGRQSGAGGV